MPTGKPRSLAFAFAVALSSVALAGCLANGGVPAPVKEIRFWVEQVDWEVHPGVSQTVWAFCAEGDGVEPVHDGNCGIPGPTVRVQKGDLVKLTFENTHTIAHTIHFHGIHPFSADMNGNAAVDGSMVVEAGKSIEIEWTAEPAGSFIYHCHFNTPTHMEMGMYGAFIVEDPDETDPPEDEFVMVLDEWAIRDEPEFGGHMPAYNYFTINGKSFPLTQPMMVAPGSHVRVHMVNAGFQFHAMHIHGYTPDSWEGVAGPQHAVPTDVREIAPGQTVVLDFSADREGVWLFHDHVVTTVTAAANGNGFGAYPRGMLTVLAVGEDYQAALVDLVPALVEAAAGDAANPGAAHDGHDHDGAADGDGHDTGGVTVDMRNVVFSPTEITVEPGTTVTWVNKDGFGHTVTLDDGTVDSGDIPAGAEWSYTFDEPGTYTYHCTPHAAQDDEGAWQGMVGTVVVEAA